MRHGVLSFLPLSLVSLVLQQRIESVQAFPAALNWTIFADQPTRIGLNLTGDYHGREWKYLRLYLSMVLPCSEPSSSEDCQTGGPTCVLRDCVATNVTGFTIEEGIPANIGPSGIFYSLAYELMNEPHYDSNVFDGNKSELRYGNSWYSSTLIGGTSKWTPYEVGGHAMWDYPVQPPCIAYNCARKCAAKTGLEPGSWEHNADMDACMAKCDGINSPVVNECVMQNDPSFDGLAWNQEVDDGLNNGGYVDPRDATRTIGPTSMSRSAPTGTGAEVTPSDGVATSRMFAPGLLGVALLAWTAG